MSESKALRSATRAQTEFTIGHNLSNIHIYKNHIHHIGRICTNDDGGRTGMYIRSTTTDVTIDGNVFHDIGRLHPGEDGCAPDNDYWTNHDQRHLHRSKSIRCCQQCLLWLPKRLGNSVLRGQGKRPLSTTCSHDANPIQNGPHRAVARSPGCVTIRNNIFHEPQGYAIDCFDDTTYTNIRIENNLTTTGVGLLDDECPSNFGLGDNLVGEDPLFVDGAGRDL